MKKALKIISLSLVTIIVLGLVIFTISYQTYWTNDPEFEINDESMKYFHENYNDCRSAFRSKVWEISGMFDSVQIGNVKVKSWVDDDLTVDWCYIPAQGKKEKLLILTSGLHGIEGYTGSAVQLMFMDKILKNESFENIGVLLIHGMNPYGFKYHRKVTENNVDLNRNGVIDTALFNSENTGYAKLKDLLMPIGKARAGSMKNLFFHLNAIQKIIKESMPVLRQAALQGQYDFDKGIYYGGKQYEPQIVGFKSILKNYMESYNVVLNVDLHTGYGKRGKMHLFINPIENPEVRSGVETIFQGVEIDWGSKSNFYTINGEYLGWANSLPENVLCIPMLFEFGTLDSQTTFGSLKSIQIMINENQGAHYGYKNKRSERKIKRRFDEMYYPSSPVWRSKVISDSYDMMNMMLDNLNKFKRE